MFWSKKTETEELWELLQTGISPGHVHYQSDIQAVFWKEPARWAVWLVKTKTFIVAATTALFWSICGNAIYETLPQTVEQILVWFP